MAIDPNCEVSPVPNLSSRSGYNRVYLPSAGLLGFLDGFAPSKTDVAAEPGTDSPRPSRVSLCRLSKEGW
jgi:hypothetical protein